MTYFTRLFKHDWTQAQRDKGADAGWAMPGGEFPIKSAKDAHNAVELAHSSHLPFDKVKAHIKSRAKALGAESEIPADW